METASRHLLGKGLSLLLALAIAGSAIVETVTMSAAQTPEPVVSGTLGSRSAETVPEGADVLIALEGNPLADQRLMLNELLLRATLPAEVSSLDLGSILPGIDLLAAIEPLQPFLEGEVSIAVLDAGSALPTGIAEISLDDPLASLQGANLDQAVLILTPVGLDGVAGVIQSTVTDALVAAGLPFDQTEENGLPALIISGLAPFGGADVALAAVDGQILIGSSTESLRPFVAVGADLQPSLADDPLFQQAKTELASESLMFGYIDGRIDLSTVSDAIIGAGLPLSLDDLIQTSGAFGFSISAAPEGLRAETVEIPVTRMVAPPKGPAADLTFADRIPETALIVVNSFALGDSFAAKVAEQLLAAFVFQLTSGTGDLQPVPADQIDAQFSAVELLLGFNIADDFIRQLSGPYGFALLSIDPVNLPATSAVLVSEIGNADGVATAITGLGPVIQAAGSGNISVTTLNLDGATFSNVEITQNGAAVTIQVGVSDDQLLVGTGDGLNAYTNETASPLSGNSSFTTALSLLPDEYDGWVYMSVDEVLNSVLALTGPGAGNVDTGEPDSAERCGEFATADEAQTAYDQDPVANFDLDADFDGIACEDFFGESADALASPEAVQSEASGLGPLVLVSWKDGAYSRTSSILLIGE